MLKTHLALCGLATALIAAPAFAQTNPPATTAPAVNAPAVNAPAVNSPAASSGASSAAMGSTQFYTNMSANQWRASKFVGVDVYGANNEKIGDVNDIIIDNQGNINAVVIGVGGFLGIGEKDVAIPFRSVEWMSAARAAGAANTSGAMNTNSTAANNTGALGTGSNTAGTGNMAANNANNTSGTAGTAGTGSNATDVTGTTVSGSSNAYPDHGVLRMTKQDLQNAPSFRYADQAAARDSGGTVNPVPAGTKQ